MENWFEDDWVIECAEDHTLEEFLEDMEHWSVPTDELIKFWNSLQ